MGRKTEEWRDIPGYDGWYQASNTGRIRSWHSLNGAGRSKEPHIMKASAQKGHTVSVSLRNNGQPKIRGVGWAVYRAFFGEIPAGMMVIHKNMDIADSRPGNLVLSNGSDLARQMHHRRGGKYAIANRKPVVKLDTDLNVVAVYSSVRRAAAQNAFDESTLRGYCANRRTSVIAGDGYIYAWDEEKALRKTLARAMRELDALGVRYTYPGTEEYWNLPLEPENPQEPVQWLCAAPLAGGGFGGIWGER